MPHKILVIEGDGIGPEVVAVAVDVLKGMGLDLEFSYAQAGYACYQDTGDPIPKTTIEAARAADATLFGAVTTPPEIPNYRSAVVTLRQELDLYANLRPFHSLGLQGGHYRDNVDFYIVRENTEGLYIGQEEQFEDYAIAKRLISRKGSERIIRFAFEQARKTGRKKVTLIHKANILRLTDGLFRRVGLEIAREYEQYGISLQEMLVDTMAMRLVKDPENFEVLVTTNLFGDILSDEAAELVGGLGIAASGNIGDQAAIFEPVHGSAPDIAGKGVANPVATLLATVMLLQYLGESKAAERLQRAVVTTIRQGILTQDLGGEATTLDVKNHVINNLEYYK